MSAKRFSERIGIIGPSEVLLIDSITMELRNRLWNLLRTGPLNTSNEKARNGTYNRIKHLVSDIIKESFDKWPSSSIHQVDVLEKFLTNPDTPWFIYYDIFDYLVRIYNSDHIYTQANKILEEENSGYRFVNKQLEPISDKVEVDSVEDALKQSSQLGFSGARTHIQTALDLLGQRPDPDYRNSIKESISAIESLIIQIGGKGDFSKVLRTLNEKLGLHSQFIQGIINLYGFTSDEDGIRHAILEQPNVGYDEAKFMLVACSALFNLLVSKANGVGILSE